MGEFLAKYKEAMTKWRKDKEADKENERGKNTHVEMAVTRHGIPLKDPETALSLDKITPEGLEEIKHVGEEEKMPYVLVTGSRGVQRARETGQAYMKGINEKNMAEIINKEGTKDSKLKEFGVYAMSELDTWGGAAKLLTPILKEAKQMVAEGKLEKDKMESYALQKYLGIPEEEFRKAGVETRRENAANIAHRLKSGDRMSKRLFEKLDVKVNNFTHSPKPDAFMMEIGLVENMDEIGGCFKPGESFSVDFYRDEKGELKEPVKLTFRGKTYELDMDKFNALSEEGKKILEAKLGEKMKKKE